ncbi:transcriptional regulator GcvA [Aestuariibius sp. HNIBRBA575]|uniref:transcriptional regulator GcvA n=1 Tax=Aestuariibius sp. HNIBRBA575 TaxID=3233343 RepID=UPI0034A41587
MDDRLPPLTALRAFDAAARHMSFSKAADELNVTPAALSFQIKSLEEHLGQPVFRRLNRAVELTDAGKALVPGVESGFSALTAAWRAARRIGDTSVLTVTAGPAITSKWLAPRMFEFASAHPEIELRFSATLRRMDFERDDIDVAIRFGEGKDQGLHSTDLIDEWITPMMTPDLASVITTPDKLGQATLLHQDLYPFDDRSLDWGTWFRFQGLDAPPKGGPRFSQADHAIDAAIAGTGVICGRYSLAEHALRTGSLVAPFALSIRLPHRYRFLCQKGHETRPHVAAFERWVLEQVGHMKSFEECRTFVDMDGNAL